MPDALRATSTEVLSYDWRNSKTERYHGQEKCLHHAGADSETGLSLRAKAADDRVDKHNINKEQQELRASRNANPQHASPNLCLRTKQRKPKPHIMIFLFEINYHQHISDQNRNERGERCTSDAELWPWTNSKNQQWSEHDIEK